jgi:hypothetical protein
MSFIAYSCGGFCSQVPGIGKTIENAWMTWYSWVSLNEITAKLRPYIAFTTA